MAKGVKRVSVNVLDKIAKENFVNQVVHNWHGTEITITCTLDFISMLEFVNDVVLSCFDDEGTYRPEIMDFAIKSNILTRYANFSMPDNLEHRYSIIYNTDAVDAVCEHVNNQQLQEIVGSINRKVKYMCDANVGLVQSRLNELVASFENIQKQTEEVFSGIESGDLMSLINAISNGGISEDKIVEAYIDKTRPDKEDDAE